jgi:hypothetical protein
MIFSQQVEQTLYLLHIAQKNSVWEGIFVEQ